MSVRRHSSCWRSGSGSSRNVCQARRRDSVSHAGSRRDAKKASKVSCVKPVLVCNMVAAQYNPAMWCGALV
jgi:hypothetical protein